MLESLARLFLLGLVSAGLLAACGGGGGGGSGGGDVPSPGNEGGVSAIPVPPPPGSLGAVLATNAADLRPLRDQALWTYRGVVYSSVGAVLNRYSSSIAHSLTTGGQVSERQSQVFLADDTITVAVQNGSVVNTVADPFGLGTKQALTYTELRSPVRVNDQYVQLQATALNIADLDGDGKAEVADITVYATVIGNEQVQLPALNRSVAAVRVNTTALVRITRSSDKVVMPVQNAVLSTWYAAGVGVIRQQTTASSSSGLGPVENEEILLSWDGVIEGLGTSAPQIVDLPPEFWTGTSPLSLPPPKAATELGNLAMLLAGRSDSSTAWISVVDSRGKMKTTKAYSGMLSNGAWSSQQLFGIDSAKALMVDVDPSVPGKSTLRLTTIDANATVVSGPNQLEIATQTVNSTSMAWDGQRLWIVTLQPADSGLSVNLVLQAFDQAGNAVNAPKILESGSLGSVNAGRIAAAQGRVLVTWSKGDPVAFRYAQVDGATGTVQPGLLGVGRMSASVVNSKLAPAPVLGSGVMAIIWRGPVFTHTSSNVMPEQFPRGVILGADNQPIKSSVGSLDDELLPAKWAGIGNSGLIASALGDRLVFAGFAYDQTVPHLPSPTNQLYSAFLRPGTNALASQAAGAKSFATDSGEWRFPDSAGMPFKVLQWADRALAVGNVGESFTSLTSIWLN